MNSYKTSKSKLSERETAQARAKITIKLWRKNLTRLKVRQHFSSDLYRSFQCKIIKGAVGNVDWIELFQVSNDRMKILLFIGGKSVEFGDQKFLYLIPCCNVGP